MQRHAGTEHPGRRRAGSTLIVTVGVLAVLAVLAVSFARMGHMEQDAARAHVLFRQARLTAEGGIEMARQEIRSRARLGLVETPWSPLTYEFEQSAKGKASAAVTIRDEASRIDLNHGTDRLVRMLAGLGLAIDASRPPIGPELAQKIVDERARRPGGRYGSVEEIRPLFGSDLAAYERVSPFLTVHAWTDPQAVDPVPVELRDRDVRDLVARAERTGTLRERLELVGASVRRRLVHGPMTVVSRPPVCINTASREVLTAVLTGLSAAPTLRNPPRSDDSIPYGRLGWVEIDLATADRVARAIVARRTATGPFRTWSEVRSFLISGVNPPADFFKAGYLWLHQCERFPRLRRLSFAREADEFGRGSLLASFSLPGPTDREVTHRESADQVMVEIPSLGLRATMPRDRGRGRDPAGEPYWAGSRLEVQWQRTEGAYTFELRPPGRTFGHELPDRMTYSPLSNRTKRGVLTGHGNVVRRRFVPAEGSLGITLLQAALILASCNPNAHALGFPNPAPLVSPVQKSELVAGTTELAFHAGGVYTITSTGKVTAKEGEIVGRYTIIETARFFDVWRQSAQKDFAAGSVWPESPERGIDHGPQPEALGLPQRTDAQGYVTLGRLRDYDDVVGAMKARTPGETSLYFNPGTRPFGTPLFAQSSGDVREARSPGSLFPEGAYGGRDETLVYRASDTLPARRGTIAFWFSPDWGSEGEAPTGRYYLLNASTPARSFWLQYVSEGFAVSPSESDETRGGRGSLVFQFDLNSRPRSVVRRVEAAFNPASGEWVHVAAVYDLDQNDPASAIRLYVNGVEHRGAGAPSDPRRDADARPEDLSRPGVRTRLGTRGRLGSHRDHAAFGAYGDFLTFGRVLTADQVRGLYRTGRFYGDADPVFTSSSWTAPADALGEPREVAAVHWTGYLPRAGYPAGKIEVQVEAGGWTSPWYGDAGASAAARPFRGTLRYRVRFSHDRTARAGAPLAVTPVLDEVTLTILGQPRVLSRREGE